MWPVPVLAVLEILSGNLAVMEMFWKSEEWRLSVENEHPYVLRKRRIGYLLSIADAPERALSLGKPVKQTRYCTLKKKKKIVQLTIFCNCGSSGYLDTVLL
jgi:hypothetical protein